MKLTCDMCGAVTVLSAAEVKTIRAELLNLGPSARKIWDCPKCARFQLVIDLRVKTERIAA
jgi:hypothetical protein